MGALYERLTSRSSLKRSWLDVLARDRADGVTAPGVARFEERLEDNLVELHAQLTDGTYQPRELTEVLISKGEGDRVLNIPAVRDRIVEHSVLEAVTPHIDPTLGPASYAYRPGLGVADAVQALVTLREEGLSWVLRTDAHDCFPSIPVGHARRMLGALVPDEELLSLVDKLIARPYRRRRGGRGVVRGLPQGCALSPLLANLVLSELDDVLQDHGFTPVRYADDLAVPTRSAADAWEAARCATATLEVWGMELGADKTEVMSFDDGLCFLGEDFGPRYPPLLEDHRVSTPEKSTPAYRAAGCASKPVD